MALKVVISGSAKADLLDLWSWIADESPTAADRQLDRVHEVVHKLAELPRMGRPRDELHSGLRSFVVGSYVLFYLVRSDRLEVVRVLHGRRDIDEVF